MKFSKLITITLTFLIICSFNKSNNTEKSQLKLWYKQPADASVKDSPDGWKDDAEWLKALPLGNGSLGLMVFGDVNKERIQLNEESMWSGSPSDNDNPTFLSVCYVKPCQSQMLMNTTPLTLKIYLTLQSIDPCIKCKH